jgi:hypothetical protein
MLYPVLDPLRPLAHATYRPSDEGIVLFSIARTYVAGSGVEA